MKKCLWFDTETTGLNSYKNDIIQIACIVEVEGNVLDQFESKIRPFDPANVEPKALEVNGLKLEDVLKYPDPKIVHKEFTKFISNYIDKFDKADKFAPAGYNIKFDIDFLMSFFRKCGDSYYGSYFNYKAIDPLYMIHVMDYERKINLPNYKLVTVCNHYNINIEAHEALSDIKATRELFKTLQRQ